MAEAQLITPLPSGAAWIGIPQSGDFVGFGIKTHTQTRGPKVALESKKCLSLSLTSR